MRNYHFHFMAVGSANDEAQMAATILTHCLQRQGYRAGLTGTTVTVMAPAQRLDEPETILILLDESQLAEPQVLNQIDNKCAVVVCSARPARMLQHELGRFSAGITTVDATGIANDEGSDPVVAMLGAAARMVHFIDADRLGTAIFACYDRSLPYAALAAMRTFDMGYMQAQLSLGH
jgi:hypothetical protein